MGGRHTAGTMSKRGTSSRKAPDYSRDAGAIRAWRLPFAASGTIALLTRDIDSRAGGDVRPTASSIRSMSG
jgi:hypothetical protein